jgi:hypothetical protein
MANKPVRRTRWITPRRLGALGCLTALAALIAFGLVFYQQLRKLGGTGETPGGEFVGMQDVTVQRGTVSVGVLAYGTVQAARVESLGFRHARAKVAAQDRIARVLVPVR